MSDDAVERGEYVLRVREGGEPELIVVGTGFFFFQAEDGIRDVAVTGVQTCALPICPNDWCASAGLAPSLEPPHPEFEEAMQTILAAARRHGVAAGIHCLKAETVNRRSEERRVGKKGRSRWSPDH